MPIADRVTSLGYRLGAQLACLLPARVAALLGRVIGRVLHRFLPARRTMVVRHQQRIARHATGAELTPPALDRQVRRTFELYGAYWVEAFRLRARSTEQMDAVIRVDGAHHIDEALALGNGVIMAMPHIGLWDIGGAWLAHHWPLTVVAEELEPPELFRWFCERREANHMRVLPLGGAETGTALLRALKANEVLGLLCDRDIAGGGIEVELFGERTTLPAGPATLSLRTGAPILPNAVYQEGRMAHGVIRPPIAFERSGRLRDDVTELTRLLAKELESLIAGAPEQWHVLQPNWPSDRAATDVR